MRLIAISAGFLAFSLLVVQCHHDQNECLAALTPLLVFVATAIQLHC
jgi:hypothetical protein